MPMVMVPHALAAPVIAECPSASPCPQCLTRTRACCPGTADSDEEMESCLTHGPSPLPTLSLSCMVFPQLLPPNRPSHRESRLYPQVPGSPQPQHWQSRTHFSDHCQDEGLPEPVYHSVPRAIPVTREIWHFCPESPRTHPSQPATDRWVGGLPWLPCLPWSGLPAPGGSVCLVGEECFRQVQVLCYIISSQDQLKEEGMHDLQETLIPTFTQWSCKSGFRRCMPGNRRWTSVHAEQGLPLVLLPRPQPTVLRVTASEINQVSHLKKNLEGSDKLWTCVFKPYKSPCVLPLNF